MSVLATVYILPELVLFFHLVGSEAQTQFIRLGGKHLCSPSRLSGPDDIFDSLMFPGYLGGLSQCVALTAFSYIHMGLIGS